LDLEGRNPDDPRALADLGSMWQRRDAPHVLPDHMSKVKRLDRGQCVWRGTLGP
jgi:hypothetical protein